MPDLKAPPALNMEVSSAAACLLVCSPLQPCKEGRHS